MLENHISELHPGSTTLFTISRLGFEPSSHTPMEFVGAQDCFALPEGKLVEAPNWGVSVPFV